jgi:hypothetical protein
MECMPTGLPGHCIFTTQSQTHSQQVGSKSPDVRKVASASESELKCSKSTQTRGSCTFFRRLKRSHSATDPSRLEESSRPPAGPGTHTSDVTLDSALPCIVCGQRNPKSGHSEIPRKNRGADERVRGEAYELVVPPDGAGGDEPELEGAVFSRGGHLGGAGGGG